MFVVLFHFGDEAPIPLHALHSVWERGYLATDFFLMLSGFVLARAYGVVPPWLLEAAIWLTTATTVASGAAYVRSVAWPRNGGEDAA